MDDYSWSYSAYSSAVKCLRDFQLTYVDKIVPEGKESGDLLFGSALHSALNDILTGGDGETVFSMYWNSYQQKEVDYGRFGWEPLNGIGLSFISKFQRLQAKKYVLETAEERLFSSYGGVRLEGTPDFIGSYQGRRSLRDFKTSGYNYAKEKQFVALQLNLYTYLAIQNGIKAPETLGYTVFNKGTGSIQDLTWDFDEKKMYAMLDDMVAYCKMVGEQKHFGKNPNGCIMGASKCRHFNLCWGGATIEGG